MATYYARLSGSCINAQICIITPKLHLSRARVRTCVRACARERKSFMHLSVCTWMIYGDQSQEGFLLRDYFCCDTNELRLQTHCRPITLEKRLRAYYAQIISRLFSSTLLRSTFGVFTPCPNVYSHVHGVCCTRKRRRAGGRAIVCDAAATAAVCIVDLSLLHCVARVLHSAVSLGAPICHLCMCQIAARVPCVRDL